MNLYEGLPLLHDALPRSRVHIRPRPWHRRPAREIALRARRAQNDLLGH
jgi:hypothetical protein